VYCQVVVFHALDEIDIKSIARIQLQYLEKRLAAETRHPGPTGEPAGQADTGRALRRERHHQGGLQGRGDEVR
jgi:hypothetical protein